MSTDQESFREILDRLDDRLSHAYGSVYVLEVGLTGLLEIAGVSAGAALALAPERPSGILAHCQGLRPEQAGEWLPPLCQQLEAPGPGAESPELAAILRGQRFLSHVVLPFKASGFALGGAILSHRGPWQPSEEHSRALRRAADKIAATLERTRLVEDLQNRVLEWGLLMRVGQEILSRPDEQVPQKCASLVAGTFGYDQVAFLRPNEEGWTVTALAGRPLSGWEIGSRIGAPDGLLAGLFVLEDAGVQWSNALPDFPGSEISVPVRVGDSDFGVLDIRAAERGAFTQRDPSILRTVGSQIAVAMQNHQLIAQVQERAESLERVADIGRRIVSVLRVEDLLQEVAELVGQRLGYEIVHILLVDGQRTRASIVADYRDGLSRYYDPPRIHIQVQTEGLVGRAVRTGEVVLVNDVRADPDFVPDPVIASLSELAIPLWVGDKLIGVLNIESSRLNAFSEDDEHILTTLANLVAVAIENASLYQREKTAAAELAERNCLLTDAQARLVSAERLAAFGELSLTVKHEINNPLTAIMGNIEWLLDGDEPLSTEARSALQVAYDMALRVRDIVQKLDNIEDRRQPYLDSLQMIDLWSSDKSGEEAG